MVRDSTEVGEMNETDEQDRDGFCADREYEELVRRAEALGREHGTAGGSGVEVSSILPAETCIRLDDEGDPDWWDHFGPASAPLSGEWADGMTPSGLARSVGLPYCDPELAGLEWLGTDADAQVMDEICDAYEQAYYDAWRDEVLRMARYQVGDQTEPTCYACGDPRNQDHYGGLCTRCAISASAQGIAYDSYQVGGE